MSNTSNSNTNNSLYNICSLEHSYTNLFALTDLTGIKWLRLRAKENINKNSSSITKSNTNSSKNVNSSKQKKAKDSNEDEKMNDDDEDDDENDEEDFENATASTTTKKDISPNNKSAQQTSIQQQLSSNLLYTTSANDPVLLTHTKCLNEDILCSWKRIQQPVNSSLGGNSSNQNKKGNNSNRKKSKANSDDDNEEDDDDDDNDDDDDDDGDNENGANCGDNNIKKNECNESDDNELNQIELNNLNDLKHKKELWIFWYEKEEPPNLRNIISPDLVAVDPQTNTINQPNTHYQNQSSDTASDISKTLSMAAYSSHNGLPYESRSMLFKALHNLIEKSLLEKGYARLGKWFVMPYNLNNINYNCSILNNNMNNSNINCFGSNGVNSSSQLTNPLNMNFMNSQSDLNIGDLNDVLSPSPNSNETSSIGSVGASGINGQNSSSSNTAGKNKSKLTSAMLSTGNTVSSNDLTKQQLLNGANNKNNTIEVTFDESNHVSYSFSFFLHGASRVCTSVDIKMHKPIRLINKLDLIKLRNEMKNFFQYKSATKNPFAYEPTNNSSKHKRHKNFKRKNMKKRFKGTSVILGPYGVSARLIGYLSNECIESKLTCIEWQQFYPLKLNLTIPNVLVIAGLDKANKLKFFYPNSFVYIVMDSDNEDEDDDDCKDEKNYEKNEFSDESDDNDRLNETNSWDEYNNNLSLDENEWNNEFSEMFSMYLGNEDNYETSSLSSSLESSTSIESSTSDDDETNRHLRAHNNQNQLNNSSNGFERGLKSTLTSKNNKKDALLSRKKNHSHSKLKTSTLSTNSTTLLNTTATAHVKETSSKTTTDSFFDSLEATIDSVARNFGTPGHQQTQQQMDSTTESPTLNKSASICSPLSVTAIFSPSSSQSPSTLHGTNQQQQLNMINKTNSPLVGALSPASNTHGPGLSPTTIQNKRRPSLSSNTVGSVGSPLKTGPSNITLKRTKSNINESSVVQPLGPPLPMNSSLADKKLKRKKNSASILLPPKSINSTDINSNDKLLTSCKNKKVKVNFNNQNESQDNFGSDLEDDYDENNNIESENNLSDTNNEEKFNNMHNTSDSSNTSSIKAAMSLAKQERILARKRHFLRKFLLNKKRFLIRINKLRFNNLHNLINYGKLNSKLAAVTHNACAMTKLMRAKILQQIKHQQVLKIQQRLKSSKIISSNNLISKQFKQIYSKSHTRKYNFLLKQKLKRSNLLDEHYKLNCEHCKSKFNSKLETQIKLKHKKYDLLNENLPLALDLIDKCHLNICTSSICATTNLANSCQNLACIRCSMLAKSTTGCTCSRLTTTTSNASNAIKTSPLVLNQISQPKKILKSDYNKSSISTKFETFHRRRCYFNHQKLDNNYKKINFVQPAAPFCYFKSKVDPIQSSSICLSKTLRVGSNIGNSGLSSLNQVKNSSSLGANKMSIGSSVANSSSSSVSTKVIRLNSISKYGFPDELEEHVNKDQDDEYDEQDQELEEGSSDNILIDLDDIEQVVKNCDEYFDDNNTINNNNIHEENDEEYGGLNELNNINEKNSKFDYEDLLLLKNLDTDQEDISLSDDSYNNDYDDDDDDLNEINSYGNITKKNFNEKSKLRSYSSSSSLSSSESSNSPKSNSYLRKQIKKFKRKEILKKTSTLTNKQQQKKIPVHLTDYQYFDKDLDDSCLFSISPEQDSHKKMTSQLQKKINRIESDNEENCDGEGSSTSSLSLNKFDSSSSSDDYSDTANEDTDDSDKSSGSNTSDSSSNLSSDTSSNNSCLLSNKPIPPPIFIRQEDTSTSLSRTYFSNLTNKYSRLKEVTSVMFRPNTKSNNNENLKVNGYKISSSNNHEQDNSIQDNIFLDKVASNKTLDDCIQIDKHINENREQDYTNPEDDDDFINEKCFDNFYSNNTDNLDYESHLHQNDANSEDFSNKNSVKSDDPYEFRIDDKNSASRTNASLNSQQMTPPKSVESIQNPASNKPGIFVASGSGVASTNNTASSSANTSNTHHSNSSAPISYDFLPNNIFEEESSADEQQQQSNGIMNIKSSETLLSTIDETTSAGPVSINNSNFPMPSAINSIQSVVMTPPSQESLSMNQNPSLSGGIINTNGIGSNSVNMGGLSHFNSMEYYDDILNTNDDSNPSSAAIPLNLNQVAIGHTKLISQPKSIKLNDYNSIINNKKRPMFANLLETNENQSTIVFNIPSLNNFSKNTKYKRVNLNINHSLKLNKNFYANKNKNLLIVKKLKWNLSTTISALKNSDKKVSSSFTVKNSNKILSKSKNSRKKTKGLNKLENELLFLNNHSSFIHHPQYIHLNSSSNQKMLLPPPPPPPAPLAPPPPPPPLLQHHSNTPLYNKQQSMNPSTPQQYSGSSVSSPFYQGQGQTQNQTLTRTLSSSSYPGSVGAPPLNYQPPSVGTPTTQHIQNPASLPPISNSLGGSPLINQAKSVGATPHTPPMTNKLPSSSNNNGSTNQISTLALSKITQPNKNIPNKSKSITNNIQNINGNKNMQFKLKPFDQIAQQTHPKSSLNLKFFLNSACFNINMSDTLLNVYRDINFDSCTLCVCNNNNIYGLDHSIYILNDILNTNELNQFSSAIKNTQDDLNNEQKQVSSQNNQTTPNQSLLIGNSNGNNANGISAPNYCTCGFSSLVNRSILSKNALAINLNVLIKLITKINENSNDEAESNIIMPYFNLINYLNKQTNSNKRDQQLFILNSSQCSGLFLEDYMEILNICQPHYLISKIQSIVKATANNKPVSSSLVARKLLSNLITSKFLNSILIRENYSWKKSFVFKSKSKQQSGLIKNNNELIQNANLAAAGSQSLNKDANKTPALAASGLSSSSVTVLPALTSSASLTSPSKRVTKKQKQALEQQKEKERKLSVSSQIDQTILSTSTVKPQSDDITKQTNLVKKIDLNQMDEKLRCKKQGEYEIIEPTLEKNVQLTSILDMFDQKYSCPFLSINESYDIFYSSGKQFDFDENYNSDYDQMFIYDQDVEENSKKLNRKQTYKKYFKLNTLTEFDENNVCKNVIKRLYLKSKSNLNDTINLKVDGDHLGVDFDTNKAYLKKKLKLKSLFSTDESNFNHKNSKRNGNKFLLHSWLYSKKDLKSNLELTKSLKLIQPLLEETVQKKYTTSRMWESFQGPLTWQHFCRLAFRDSNTNKRNVNHHGNSGGGSSNNNISSSHHQNGNGGGSGGSSNQSGGAGSSSGSSGFNYEPEPIPSLLVSSSDKDSWLTVSPYAIKFWDKLNFEPYSKQKNIAYVVLMPDFSGLFNDLNDSMNVNTNSNSTNNTHGNGMNQFDSNSLNDDFFGTNTNKTYNNTNGNNELNDQFLTTIQSVKEYFKELNSVYELCRLGIHRPALRLAPDQGFIRVPLNKFKANKIINKTNENSSNIYKTSCTSPNKKSSKTTNSTIKKEFSISNSEDHATATTTTTTKESVSDGVSSSKINVDEWFNKIQAHKSTRQLGHNLKSYAKILKSLGNKIAMGHSSTMTTTIQSNIFNSNHTDINNKNENKTDNLASGVATSKNSSQQPSVKPPQVLQSFQSTIIPTVSSINLDRSLFEEIKPSKHIDNPPPNVVQSNTNSSNNLNTTNSSLSSLLNQPINQTDIINLSQTDFSINHNHSSANSGNQAQILTNFSSTSNMNQMNPGEQSSLINANTASQLNSANSNSVNASSSNANNNSILHQQQQTLNNLASGSNLTQISQLTANLTHPPCLVVYIIDPFDYYLYNRIRIHKSKPNSSTQHSKTSPNKTNTASSNNKNNSSKLNLKKKMKDTANTAKTSTSSISEQTSTFDSRFPNIKNEPIDQQQSLISTNIDEDTKNIANATNVTSVSMETDIKDIEYNTDSKNKLLDATKDKALPDIDSTFRDELEEDHHNSSASTCIDENFDLDEDEEYVNDDEYNRFDEFDLKRLRHLGLFKAYLELYNQLPDLFKSATQFQVLPLSLCTDLQQHATSMYIQSLLQSQSQNYQQTNSISNYSNIYSAGFGSSWSDLDMDFKLSLLKNQAFNIFALSKRFYMSPAHNYYLNLNQQQNNSTRPKSLTGFGPAAAEERFLRKNLLSSNCDHGLEVESFSQLKKMQFYAPPFILAPSTITTTAVALAASNLFFKNTDMSSSSGATTGGAATSKSAGPLSLNLNTNGGECNGLMPHFIQLNMSNSNYGFLNLNNNFNFNLSDLIHQQQHFLTSTTIFSAGSSSSLINNTNTGSNLNNNNSGGSSTGGLFGSGSNTNVSNGSKGGSLTSQTSSSSSSNNGASSTSGASGTMSSANLINSNYLTTQPHQQQCNVLYVSYCLSDDQRFLLASCCDENGELIESTSISIEVDERIKRTQPHTRRIGLRKLWEFIMVIISQTCKPWRLVIGRLGRMGHSELRGWACLLSKKNLQRVCQQLKDSCETCNILGNMEVPCILSGCLISMEACESICVYPEAFSREDKLAAAALTGQTLVPNHASQAHGVSCTHILTFPASAIAQSASNIGVGLKDGDPSSKSDSAAIDDNDFFSFFKFEEDDMNELLNENMNDKVLNESGANGNDGDQASAREKIESLLNQEEIAHLDQQPLAVGYYVSTARCGPLPKWLRGDISLDSNFHTFKATLHIHNSYALENDELQMKTENSHKLDSPVTYEVLRYVLERYNALSWLNIDPLIQDRKSCLPIHHTILLQMYYAFKNYI